MTTSAAAESGPPGDPRNVRLARDGAAHDEQCIVHFLGGDVTTASFAMYTFSAAVLMQAIVLVCFSSFADHGAYFPCLRFGCEGDFEQQFNCSIAEKMEILITIFFRKE